MPSSNVAPRRRFGDDQAEVGPVENLPRPLHAQFAERAGVVNARRINEQHRPERQQLHRLLDRVGGRAGHVGDDRDVLPRQAFSSDDLPTLRRPKMPMCRRKLLACFASKPDYLLNAFFGYSPFGHRFEANGKGANVILYWEHFVNFQTQHSGKHLSGVAFGAAAAR